MEADSDFDTSLSLAFQMEAETSDLEEEEGMPPIQQDAPRVHLTSLKAGMEVLDYLLENEFTHFTEDLFELTVDCGEGAEPSAFGRHSSFMNRWAEKVKGTGGGADGNPVIEWLCSLKFLHCDHRQNGRISRAAAARHLKSIEYLAGDSLSLLSLPFPDCELDWVDLLSKLPEKQEEERCFPELAKLKLFSKNLVSDQEGHETARAIFEAIPSLESITVFPAPDVSSQPSGIYSRSEDGLNFKLL